MDKIVILHTDVAHDASEDELDTLIQAQIVAETLSSLGYDTILLPFVMDLQTTIAALRSHAPHAVFNLVETLAGQGRMVYFATALLDFLRLPYTGCRTDAMFLTSNKPLAKKMLQAGGIATPPWLTDDGNSFGLSFVDTWILKPCWEDASVGLDEQSIIRTTDRETLLSVMHNRKQNLGMDFFAEAYIDGREFNIALLASDQGVRILPPSEILFLNYPSDKFKILDYQAKWVEDSFEYDHTQRSLSFDAQDAYLLDRLKDVALNCWNIFSLKGYARVDFRVDQNGQPWVLEINANPCLSPDAGFAAALDFTGIKYADAIDHIVRDALKDSGIPKNG